MQINVVCCLYVLSSEKNENIRKNDVKKIQVLMDRNGFLPGISFNGGDMKKELKKYLKNIIGSNLFHLEQVYSMGYENSIDIIYLAITNMENVVNLDKNYELKEFKIVDNKFIILGDSKYNYKTKEIEENNNIEYIHEISVKEENIRKTLYNLLISYKRLRSSLDNTDIIFKFMGSTFTLEDVRIVYELIKDASVDKSNFRKKIIKYCEKVNFKEETKNGFRPSQKYKFKPLKGDVWV